MRQLATSARDRLNSERSHHHSGLERVLDLTPRETEILDLVAGGYSNRRIAARLRVSPNTVRNHLHAAYGKLGVGTRLEAVALLLSF